MKPLYKIIIVAVIGVLVVLGIYFGWRAITSGPGEKVELPAPETQGGPTAGDVPTLKKLSDEAAFDFWTNPDTREVFYATPDGRVMNAKDGPDLEISKQTINALNFIEVGPKSQKILAAFGDPRAPQWGIFDVIDGAWRPLPSDIANAAWSDDNEELIVVVKNGGNLNLAAADISQTPPSYKTLIRDFRLKEVKLTQIAENRVIISELPAASYASSIWQLDLGTLDVNLLNAPEAGLNVRWSKDKNFAFIGRTNSGLLISDGSLETTTIPPFISLPEKCATDPQKIYCFTPQNIPAGTVLPDDYLMKKFYSIDDLVTLEVESGEFTRVLTSGSASVPAIDAKNPQVLGDKIYFINRYDSQLYELGL